MHNFFVFVYFYSRTSNAKGDHSLPPVDDWYITLLCKRSNGVTNALTWFFGLYLMWGSVF